MRHLINVIFFLLVASASYGQVFSVKGRGAALFRVTAPVSVTANYSQTGTIIVSDNGATYEGNSNTPNKVFDGDPSTYYDGPNGDPAKYIGRDLGSPKAVNTVRVLGRQMTGEFGAQRLNTAQIQYSINGSDWTTVYTVSGINDSNYMQYTVANNFGTITAQYWRMFWPNGNSYTNAAEMEIRLNGLAGYLLLLINILAGTLLKGLYASKL